MIHTAICHAVATLLVSVAASGAVAGEVMDKMMRMQHMHDELMSGVKGHTTTDPTTTLKVCGKGSLTTRDKLLWPRSAKACRRRSPPACAPPRQRAARRPLCSVTIPRSILEPRSPGDVFQ